MSIGANNKNILVIGSLAYDYIMNFDGRFKEHIMPDKVHIINVSFTAQKLSKEFGGTAGNIAYNLKLLGNNPVIVATTGDDFTEYAQWLKANQISNKYIKILKNNYTASAHIITDLDDNQITSFYGGAMMGNDKSIAAIIKTTKPKLAILAPNCKKGMVNHHLELAKNNIDYIFDPGQMIIAFNKNELVSMFSHAKAAIFNDYEMQLFTEKTKIEVDKARKMIEYLIITLGSSGSLIYYQGKKFIIPPARPKSNLDPTGAGDAYRAGVITGMLNGWDIDSMGRAAGLCSIYTVEKYGTQTHKFSINQFKKRYRQNFNTDLKI